LSVGGQPWRRPVHSFLGRFFVENVEIVVNSVACDSDFVRRSTALEWRSIASEEHRWHQPGRWPRIGYDHGECVQYFFKNL